MQDMKLLAIQDVLKELMPFLLKEDEMPEEIDPTEDMEETMELPEEGEVVIEIEMEPEGGDEEEIAEMVDEEDDEEEIDIKKLLGIR